MGIKEIPPQPNPKHLTAVRLSKNLLEHKEAFLSINVKEVEVEEEIQGPIAKTLLQLVGMQYLNKKMISEVAHLLLVEINKAISYTTFLNHAARALGYKDWQEVCSFSDKQGNIVNRNFGVDIKELIADLCVNIVHKAGIKNHRDYHIVRTAPAMVNFMMSISSPDKKTKAKNIVSTLKRMVKETITVDYPYNVVCSLFHTENELMYELYAEAWIDNKVLPEDQKCLPRDRISKTFRVDIELLPISFTVKAIGEPVESPISMEEARHQLYIKGNSE